MALRPPALRDKRRFRLTDFAGEFDNARLGNAGDGRGPCRRFGGAIRPVAENIRLIVTVHGRAGRQGFLVIANAVVIQERLIDIVFSDQHPGDRGGQRGVGAGADRDPLIFAPGGSIGIARIDDYHPRLRFRARLLKVICYAAAAHAGFAGVIAKQHHQLAVFDIRRAVAVGPAAIGVVEAGCDLRAGVIAVVVKIAAAAVHQPGKQRFPRRPGAGHGAAKRTGAVVEINRLVTVFADDTLHAPGDGIQRLIPADAHKFAFAAFADALHRVFQAVRVVDAPPHGAPAQAGAHLVQPVVVIAARVIRFDIADFAIHHMHTQRAAAAAVNGTGAPDDALVRRADGVLDGGGHLSDPEGQGDAACRERQTAKRGGFHQRAAADPDRIIGI